MLFICLFSEKAMTYLGKNVREIQKFQFSAELLKLEACFVFFATRNWRHCFIGHSCESHTIASCVISLLYIVYVPIIQLCIMLFLTLATSSTDKPVTDVCLGCICEAISGCNQTRYCGSGVCGLFRITWAYWADGGKLTLGNDSPQSETGKCKKTATLGES